MTVETRICATPADKRRPLEVYNAVNPDEAITEAEAAAFEAAATAFADFLATVDGEDVGSAFVAINPQLPVVAFTLVTVLPSGRRRGAGSALYAAVSQWTAEQGRDELETRVAPDDAESLAFAVRRGLVEHQREEMLELDISAHAPALLAPPDGVTIVSLAERPDLAGGAFDVACEAVPDIPGEEDWVARPREEWIEHHLYHPATPPEATFFAVAGTEVVGFARLRVRPDHQFADHAMTGVKRAWRRLGIAAALKSAQNQWAARNGITNLRTSNEVRNAPIRAVNERLGYVAMPGRVTVRGPLAI